MLITASSGAVLFSASHKPLTFESLREMALAKPKSEYAVTEGMLVDKERKQSPYLKLVHIPTGAQWDYSFYKGKLVSAFRTKPGPVQTLHEHYPDGSRVLIIGKTSKIPQAQVQRAYATFFQLIKKPTLKKPGAPTAPATQKPAGPTPPPVETTAETKATQPPPQPNPPKATPPQPPAENTDGKTKNTPPVTPVISANTSWLPLAATIFSMGLIEAGLVHNKHLTTVREAVAQKTKFHALCKKIRSYLTALTKTKNRTRASIAACTLMTAATAALSHDKISTPTHWATILGTSYASFLASRQLLLP